MTGGRSDAGLDVRRPPTAVPPRVANGGVDPADMPTEEAEFVATGGGDGGAYRRGWLAPGLIVLLAVAAWEAGVRITETPRWLLPPPSAVARTLVADRVLLLDHARVTLVVVLLGFGLALLAGVLLAVAIAASPTLERAVYPLVIATQTVPVPALAPLLLIWFGYGLLPKVLVAALVGFFPIVVNAVDGLRATDREVLALLRSFGAGRWARFRLARLPSALPFVFSGAKVAVAVCVIGAVFGELVGAKAGLGYLLTRAIAQFQTERVVAAVLLLSLIAIGLFAAVAGAERLLLPWRRYGSGGNNGPPVTRFRKRSSSDR